MGVIWLSPNAYVTTDPTLQIAYVSPARPAAVVTCTAPGTKSITAALPLPPRAIVEQLIICYECSDAASHIAGIKLLETTLPGVAVVRHDSPIRLDATRPICAPAGLTRFTPSGSVILELQLRFDDIAHQISFGALGIRIGDDCSVARNDHLLGEYGPYATVADAYKTLDKAVAAIVKEGGGVLCIPRDAPHGFFPRNLEDAGIDEAAVTIVDYRDGTERTYVPPIGVTNSEGGAAAGRVIERDLAVTLGWQSTHPAVAISSRAAGGASSYSTRLSRAVTAGAGRRIYVPTLRGAFIGQRLLVDPGGMEEHITVAGMGLDGGAPYLVADVTGGHAAGVQIYNKNALGGLLINDVSNCDNQSGSLTVQRTTYGTGDSFGVTAILTYQGNINSGLGDEGAVAFAGNLEHDTVSFTGEVESWDKTSRVLKYKDGARYPQKLGTSRPIINFNRGKHITAGTVKVTDAGGGLRVVIGDAAASAAWSSALAGRFFTIDEPTEYYPEEPGRPVTERTYRWWMINRIDPPTGSPKKLYVERAVAHDNFFDGPTLFRNDNYGKDLHYIIAPGAWVSDVRNGVAGTVQGNIGAAHADDPRLIVLAPSPTEGTKDDFEAGDAIANPPGADVWLPTGFRARNVPRFPGSIKGASFLSENLGTVQMGTALQILGSGVDASDLAAVRAHMKDDSTEYESGIYINAATDKAIVIRGAVSTASAIELWQAKDIKKIRWLDRAARLAGELHVDPDSGWFIFTGKGLDLDGQKTIAQAGLSATRTASSTLGGKNVAVADTASTASIAVAENDTDYAVFVTCSWMTMTQVVKNVGGFTVHFSAKPPTGGGTFDWFLVRP